MDREYYIEKLESLEVIEEYKETMQRNITLYELIAFLNSEMTTDKDIVREIRNETERGKLLKEMLKPSDAGLIKAWNDAEKLTMPLKEAVSKGFRKINRGFIIEKAKKSVKKAERPKVIKTIDKLKNSDYLVEEDIDSLFNSVVSSDKFNVKDVEAILILVDGINKSHFQEGKVPKRKANREKAENSKEVQEDIKNRLKELFEKYNFTWDIYPDGNKWYVLTTKDEIIAKLKKHVKDKKEIVKVGIVDGLTSRYEEHIDFIAKHGNIKDIETMLEYLKDKKLLDKICFNGEILAKTLVYSKPNDIDNLIEVIKEHTKDKSEATALDIISRAQTLLFKSTPSIGSKRTKKGDKDKRFDLVSGSLTTFLDSMKLLDEHGIKIDLSERGFSLIGVSTEKIKRNVEILETYGIPLNEKDAMSVLITTDPGKLIDLAIESDAFDYIRANLSKTINLHYTERSFENGIIPNDLLPYVLKYYKERIDRNNYKELWNTPQKKLRMRDLIPVCPFVSTYEIFEEYGKVRVKLDSNLEETFDKIVSMSDNTSLYDFKEDEYIKAFDEQFRSEDDDFTYRFGNVIISRYKFLRYYNTLINKYYLENADTINMVYDEGEIKNNILLYALTKDSMLDEKELGTIIKSVKSFEINFGMNSRNR